MRRNGSSDRRDRNYEFWSSTSVLNDRRSACATGRSLAIFVFFITVVRRTCAILHYYSIHRGACRNNNNNNSAAAAGTRRRLRNRRRRLGNSRAAVSVRSPPSYHHRRARLFRSRRRRLFRLVDDKCVCVIRVFLRVCRVRFFFWRSRQTIFSLSVVCDNPSPNVSDCRRPVGRTGGQRRKNSSFPAAKTHIYSLRTRIAVVQVRAGAPHDFIK